jgi:hypothetical protein
MTRTRRCLNAFHSAHTPAISPEYVHSPLSELKWNWTESKLVVRCADMWHTPLGDRVLTGPEATLFRYGLRSLLDFLSGNPDQDWLTGVAVFDDLQYPQKIALLWQVASAVLKKKVLAPKLTAVNEAAIAAVYGHIQMMVECEVEMERGKPFVRNLMRNCLREEFAQEGLDLPHPRCENIGEWHSLVDACADRILWDRDYEDGDQFLDTPPAQANVLKKLLRIDDDYYAAVPPDLKPRQVEDCLRRLRRFGRRGGG